MKNTLPEKRKFLAVHRCLQRQLADVRTSHKRFFSCTREDQHAHRRVIARVEQRMPQFFDGLAVQRIQHLRPVEGDVGNPVFLLVQNVLVAHFFPLPGLALLSVSSANSVSSVPAVLILFSFRISAPSDSPDRNNRKTRVPISYHSTPPTPCASATAAPRIAAP